VVTSRKDERLVLVAVERPCEVGISHSAETDLRVTDEEESHGPIRPLEDSWLSIHLVRERGSQKIDERWNLGCRIDEDD
jgi:hypothetical protein